MTSSFEAFRTSFFCAENGADLAAPILVAAQTPTRQSIPLARPTASPPYLPKPHTECSSIKADCLYLDTNAPVHDCSHGDPANLPKDEDEILERFFEWFDHLMNMVRVRLSPPNAVSTTQPSAHF